MIEVSLLLRRFAGIGFQTVAEQIVGNAAEPRLDRAGVEVLQI